MPGDGGAGNPDRTAVRRMRQVKNNRRTTESPLAARAWGRRAAKRFLGVRGPATPELARATPRPARDRATPPSGDRPRHAPSRAGLRPRPKPRRDCQSRFRAESGRRPGLEAIARLPRTRSGARHPWTALRPQNEPVSLLALGPATCPTASRDT
jgi:hypothetical protein